MFINFVDACLVELGPSFGRPFMHGVIVAVVIAGGACFMWSHSTSAEKRQKQASGTMSSSLGLRIATAYAPPLASALGLSIICHDSEWGCLSYDSNQHISPSGHETSFDSAHLSMRQQTIFPSEYLRGRRPVLQEPPAHLCPLEAVRRTVEPQVSLETLPCEDLTPGPQMLRCRQLVNSPLQIRCNVQGGRGKGGWAAEARSVALTLLFTLVRCKIQQKGVARWLEHILPACWTAFN